MHRQCSEIYCNCSTSSCQFIGPSADLQRAKNDLIAHHEKVSKFPLLKRFFLPYPVQIELKEILKRIRKAEYGLAEERKRHGTRN